MNQFLTSNDTKWRLARTIVQGIISVIIANLDILIGHVAIDPAMRPVITGIIMAILSPIMSIIGQNITEE